MYPKLQGVSLQAKVLHATLSTGVSCVSVGMREVSQILENQEALHYEKDNQGAVNLFKELNGWN